MCVSIGLPFYNNEQTLADAIRSVFAQTFSDWELILIDDGSFDGSLSIAQAVDDPRVRVLSDPANKGLSFRLNQITALAQGTYIARMDADDLMHPERLAYQIHYLETHPGVDLVGTGTYTIDAACQPVGLRGVGVLEVKPQAVLNGKFMIHPTVVGRADWFRRNPYRESYRRSQDVELWCRTGQYSNFANLPALLYFYREGTVTSKREAAYLHSYLESSRSIRKTLLTYGPPIVGWPRALFLILESQLKDAIYRCFTALGKQNILLQQRNKPLSEPEQTVALTVIDKIRQTPAPGLSEPKLERIET
ncbi:MAG: glycosyltransferase family A protein [Chloroflexota bacterium]